MVFFIVLLVIPISFAAEFTVFTVNGQTGDLVVDPGTLVEVQANWSGTQGALQLLEGTNAANENTVVCSADVPCGLTRTFDIIVMDTQSAGQSRW